MTKMVKNPEFIVIKTTFPKEEEAKIAAKKLVEISLAKCVQISTIESCFKWDEKICFEKEFLLEIKTAKTNFLAISEEIKKSHPYQIPQILAYLVSDIDEEYQTWLSAN